MLLVRLVTARPKLQMINVKSTLRTVPDLRKNVSHAVALGSDGNAYTIFTQPDICVCVYVCVCVHIHILHNMETLVGQKKKKGGGGGEGGQ